MRRWIVLTLFGCTLLGLNLVGRHLQREDGITSPQWLQQLPWFVAIALAQGAVYLIAVWLVLRDGPAPRSLAVILVFAALLRLTILFAPPYLSDDIYRYVWDGRVQAAGVNPYRFVPADPALQGLRDGAVYQHINRRDYAHTIYPPLAQSIFLGITRVSESVTWMKTCMVGFEVVAIWLLLRLLVLLGLPAQRVLIYAWHPLTVWEFAGSGHVDAAAIALLAVALWARQRKFPALTGIVLAGATLVKLFPALLFPALYRRWDWKMPLAFLVTLAAGYVPYASLGTSVFGFLPGYLQEEGLKTGWSIYLLNVRGRTRLASRRHDLGRGVLRPFVTALSLVFCVLAALAGCGPVRADAVPDDGQLYTLRSVAVRECASVISIEHSAVRGFWPAHAIAPTGAGPCAGEVLVRRGGECWPLILPLTHE